MSLSNNFTEMILNEYNLNITICHNFTKCTLLLTFVNLCQRDHWDDKCEIALINREFRVFDVNYHAAKIDHRIGGRKLEWFGCMRNGKTYTEEWIFRMEAHARYQTLLSRLIKTFMLFTWNIMCIGWKWNKARKKKMNERKAILCLWAGDIGSFYI